MRQRVFGMAVMATISLFLTTALALKKDDKSAADVLGGNEVVDTILKADKVEVYRLKDQFFKEKLAEYEASAGPTELDPKLAKPLAETLVAYDSYEREIAKACEPIFGVRATFIRGAVKTDVLFCFQCQILTVYHQGKRVGGGEFDPVKGKLEKLVKQIFPKDAAIQKLGME